MAAFMGVILSWGGAPPRGRTTATTPLCVRRVVVCRGGRVEPEMPATGGRGGYRVKNTFTTISKDARPIFTTARLTMRPRRVASDSIASNVCMSWVSSRSADGEGREGCSMVFYPPPRADF